MRLQRSGAIKLPGIIKDVAMLGGFQEMDDVDFTANNPRADPYFTATYAAAHMDFGFMALFDYA